MFTFNYSGSKDPRLTCLNVSSLAFLQQCKESLELAPKQYCGVQHHAQIEQELRLAVYNTNSKHFKHWRKQYSHNQETLKRYRWQQATQKKLIQGSFWQHLSEKIPAKYQDDFKQLSKRFMLHGEYAHYSSAALQHIAHKILPSLEAYCQFAKQEWQIHQSHLDNQTRIDFKNFILLLDEWIMKTQATLADAMAQRLIAASRAKDPYNDDVINETLLQLKKWDALPFIQTPKVSRGLTPELSNCFLQFIAKGYSNHAILHVRHEVSWLNAHPNYITVNQNSHLLIAPKSLEHFLYRLPAYIWWEKLTRRFDLTKYLINRQHLLGSIRILEQPAAFSEENLSVFCDNLAKLQKSLSNEFKHLQANIPRGFFSRFWYSDTRAKMQHILEYYKQSADLVLDKSIGALKFVLDSLEGRCTLTEQITFDHEDANQVQKLVSIIQGCYRINPLYLSQKIIIDGLIQRFDNIKKRIIPEVSPHVEILQELAKGQFRENGGLHVLYDYANNLKIVNPNEFEVFQTAASDARIGVINAIKSSVNQLQNDFQTISETSLKTISRAIVCIKHIGNPHDFQQIQKLSQQLYAYYIKQAKISSTPLTWLTNMEALLLIMSQNFELLEIQHHVSHLKLLRSSGKLAEYQLYGHQCLSEQQLKKERHQLNQLFLKYEELLWKQLQNTLEQPLPSCLLHLVNKAIEKNCESVYLLPGLTHSQKTILKIEKNNFTMLYWLDKILWIKSHSAIKDIPDKSLPELIENCHKQIAVAEIQLKCIKQNTAENSDSQIISFRSSLGVTS